MAVFINRRKKLTTKQLIARANKIRVSRSFVWIDPYPEVPGTIPEKMVYAELMRRKIPFAFQSDLHIPSDLIDLESNQWYKPDFIILDQKIIIEVQGAYWHQKPAQIEQDSFKYALYEFLGYKVLLWWDYDILSRVIELANSTGVLGYRTNQFKSPGRSDVQAYADGRQAAQKRGLKLRKPWTKKPVSIKIRKRRKSPL